MVSNPVILNKIRTVVFSNTEPSITAGILWGRKDEDNNFSFYAFTDGRWEKVKSQTGPGGEITIQLGDDVYHSIDGTVFLPAYPTALPASDVYEWAKAVTKPTYDYSEIGNTPTIPTALADLTDDSTHRLVTDASISAWNAVVNIIPSSAYDSGNELADKAFVNSSIATATATYRGSYNLITDLLLTTSATQSDIATALGTTISTSDKNDYCFVQIPADDLTPTVILRIERYKNNGTSWEYEYTLNNSGFTAAQWAAINSGLASADKTKLDGIATGAEVNTIDTITVNGTAVTPTSKTVALTIPPKMSILSYGHSTWADFLAAYNENAIVYCRASSNTNPGTGVQGRMAFMAYIGTSGSSLTSVEFQYYRSVTTHSDTQQGDQVYVYKLESNGTWSVTTREAYTKVVAGTNMSSSYSNGTITLSATDTNTHRPIEVGGTQILGDNTTALNFVAGTNISLSNSGGSVTIGMNSDAMDMGVETFSGTTLSVVVGKYYRATESIGTLAITLPAVTDTTKTKSIILNFATGSTPNITFTSADSKTISYYSSYSIEANKEYEVNAMFNGAKWIIASAEIATA